MDVFVGFDGEGCLCLRPAPEASQDDRVFVSMLRLNVEAIIGPTGIVKAIMSEATAEGPDPPPQRTWKLPH